MKIALLRKNFSTDGGGAERVAANFVKEFVKRGHHISIFSETYKGDLLPETEWVKVPKSLFRIISGTYSFHKSVQSLLRKYKFDLIYSMCRTYPSDIFRVTEQLHSEWLPLGYGKLAGFTPRHMSILRLERAMFREENTRAVVTNSELVKSQIIRRYRYPEERIFVVRNGVDRSIYFPPSSVGERKKIRFELGIQQEKNIVLFAAANFRIKGLASAIKAFALLSPELRKNTLLYIAGGDDKLPYVRLAKKLGVADCLYFAGIRKNMRELYAASDILLYPSLYEPFANVCLEAAACALPLITTSVNGSSELIHNSHAGYVVKDASCIDEMVVALTEFFGMDRDEKAKCAAAALEASAEYSWSKHADELEKIFERISIGSR